MQDPSHLSPRAGGTDRLPAHSRGHLSTPNSLLARSLTRADVQSEEPQCLPGDGWFPWAPCFAGLRLKVGSGLLQQPGIPQNSLFPVLTQLSSSIYSLDNYSLSALLCARLFQRALIPGTRKSFTWGCSSTFRDEAQRGCVTCLQSHSSREAESSGLTPKLVLHWCSSLP